MKQVLLGALLLTLPVAAQECKFEVNKVDDFSKKQMIRTYSRPLAVGYDYNLSLTIGASNKVPFLSLSATYEGGSTVGSVNPSFFILLNNDEIIEFTSISVESGKRNQIMYPVSVKDLERIRDIGIKKIKYAATNGTEQYDIKKTDKKLVNNIQCVLNEIAK